MKWRNALNINLFQIIAHSYNSIYSLPDSIGIEQACDSVPVDRVGIEINVRFREPYFTEHGQIWLLISGQVILI